MQDIILIWRTKTLSEITLVLHQNAVSNALFPWYDWDKRLIIIESDAALLYDQTCADQSDRLYFGTEDGSSAHPSCKDMEKRVKVPWDGRTIVRDYDLHEPSQAVCISPKIQSFDFSILLNTIWKDTWLLWNYYPSKYNFKNYYEILNQGLLFFH